MFVLVGKAYSTIKLPDLCTLVGQSAEQAKQSEPLTVLSDHTPAIYKCTSLIYCVCVLCTGAVEKGWELDTQSNVVRPKPLDCKLLVSLLSLTGWL